LDSSDESVGRRAADAGDAARGGRGGRERRGGGSARRMRVTRRAADAGGHCTWKRCAAYELDEDACGTAADITSRNIPSFIDSFRRGEFEALLLEWSRIDEQTIQSQHHGKISEGIVIVIV
jgi:hypothetical protein